MGAAISYRAIDVGAAAHEADRRALRADGGYSANAGDFLDVAGGAATQKLDQRTFPQASYFFWSGILSSADL